MSHRNPPAAQLEPEPGGTHPCVSEDLSDLWARGFRSAAGRLSGPSGFLSQKVKQGLPGVEAASCTVFVWLTSAR